MTQPHQRPKSLIARLGVDPREQTLRAAQYQAFVWEHRLEVIRKAADEALANTRRVIERAKQSGRKGREA